MAGLYRYERESWEPRDFATYVELSKPLDITLPRGAPPAVPRLVIDVSASDGWAASQDDKDSPRYRVVGSLLERLH